MGRLLKGELEHRLDLVMPLVIEGYAFREIREAMAKAYESRQPGAFEVSDSTLHNYVARCNEKIWAKADQLDLEHEFGDALAKLKRLYTRASNDKDLRTALAVMREVIALLGLAAPVKFDLSLRDKRAEAAELVWRVIEGKVVEGAESITAEAAAEPL